MRSLLVLMVLCAASLAPASAAQPVDTPVFPTVSFSSLGKSRVTLPADLHGDRNLLLLYFKLNQQPDVDGWNTLIEKWRVAYPLLGDYTCLVSPRQNILARWWQNASLRSSASPKPDKWSTTVPLYVDKPSFLKMLGIDSEKQVTLLLIDRQGRVLSRVSGPPTEQSRVAVSAALAAAGAKLQP